MSRALLTAIAILSLHVSGSSGDEALPQEAFAPGVRGHVVRVGGPGIRLGEVSPHVLVSPDGKLVATITREGAIVLWDTTAPGRSDRRRYTFQTTGRHALTLASFSPDSRFLVTIAPDNTIKLLDVASGREHLRIENADYSIRAAVFSQNGSALMVVSDDSTIHVWNLAVGGRRFRIEAKNHVGESTVTLSPNGRLLALADPAKGTIQMWNTASGARGAIIRPEKRQGRWERFVSFRFLPRGKGMDLLVRTDDETVRIYDLETGRGAFEVSPIPDAKYMHVPSNGRFIGEGGETARPGELSAHRMWEKRCVVVDFPRG